MAFSIRKREEKKGKLNLGIVDPDMMQDLQEHFCEAHNLYLACISKRYGVITKAYGSKEELAYLHSRVDMDTHVALLDRLLRSDTENGLKMELDGDLTRICGIAVRVSGEIAACWIAIGIMKDAKEEIPSYMKCTTEEQFDKSVQFLEMISKQLFAVKQGEHLAQEAFAVSRASENKMEAKLRRNVVLASIVSLLDSENDFTKIVDEVLRKTGEYLQVSNCALVKETSKGDLADMICEYTGKEEYSVIERMQNISKKELPFFDGKTYIISANEKMTEAFRRFFEGIQIKAGIFLPVTVGSQTSIYLCFIERKQEKVWSAEDELFLNDVRRIVQTILLMRTAQDALVCSHTSMETVLENVGCGIYVRDAKNGQVIYTNKLYRTAFGSIFGDEGMNTYITAATESLEFYQEHYFKKQEKWLAIQYRQITWTDGREAELCAVFDVSAKTFYQKKMEQQASHDSLTGLYNRMRCEQDLERCLQTTIEIGTEGAILYIDLDDFKHINDGLGHQYGDALLQSIARHLRQISNVGDHCYRVGGDEFVIIVHHENYHLLSEMIEGIRSLFAKAWRLKGKEYYCTMSMSVVRFPAEGKHFDDLIKKADVALFNAKNAGKNRVFYYDENQDIGSYKRLDLEKHMRNATQSRIEEFEVFFQPIVNVQAEGMPCAGAEALVRWRSAELGFVSPGDFIPLAEYLGLIIPIGTHVLREACKHCKYWNDMGQSEFTVNVNFFQKILSVNLVFLCYLSQGITKRMAPGRLTISKTLLPVAFSPSRAQSTSASVRKVRRLADRKRMQSQPS